MPEGIEKMSVSLAERQVLIKELVCFSMLKPSEAKELASLMQEETYSPGQFIVVEDELVDRVYILVSGEAEVTHQVMVKKHLKKNRVNIAPLAVIGPGDAIGLNDTGFFSTTGKRTATVTATTKVKVLSIDLKSLHLFLQAHSHLQTKMYAAATQMLRVRLIKQSLPFVKLSYERTQWLATQVEEIQIAPGTVIFQQGEKGDSCYLIRSGHVEIEAAEEDGTKHALATLKAGTLFGEATLITHDPRNATARAMDECELLVLKHKHLSELIESEENVAKMFMTLMVDRSRPLRNPHVSAHHRITADGQSIVILKNPDNGSYFKLSTEGWFIWEQLDGKKTMHAITMALSNEFNTFAPDIVAALLSKLAKARFISNLAVVDESAEGRQSHFTRVTKRLRQLLEFQYAFGDADGWLTQVYNKGIYLLFSKMGKILMSLLAVTGFVIFLANTGSTIDTFEIMPHVWWIFVWLVPCTVLSVALHELGHAFATKSFGYEVHYMGVGWYWMSPVAFTDTSDMWLSTRGPRIVVNLAGVFTDTLVAGVASILILLIANPYVEAFLWFFALYTYINAFRMLSPLQELDGYYVLMDWVDKPHLRQAAVLWLVKKFPKALRNPSLFKNNLPEVYYWLACIVFIILISLLTLFVQTVVFKMLGLHASNIYLSLSFPIFIAIISSLGVVGEIRNQSD
ncbi:MAG: PqqD family peptide modification chaperone [Gammaproteobacteria bacterium]|nr:PqqD family peptide modification chaperone [Gammaproteobacteria bacterium]